MMTHTVNAFSKRGFSVKERGLTTTGKFTSQKAKKFQFEELKVNRGNLSISKSFLPFLRY